MGKGDSRLHARTQADADTMAAKWEQTFGSTMADRNTLTTEDHEQEDEGRQGRQEVILTP